MLVTDKALKTLFNGIKIMIKRLLDKKQDKLIAGDNITIDNNIISSKGGGSVSFDDTITQNAQTGKYGIDFTSWVADEQTLDLVFPLEPEDDNKAVDAIDIAYAVNALGIILNRQKQDKLSLKEGLEWFGGIDHVLELDYAQYNQQTQTYDANKPIKGSTYTEGLNGKQDTITVDNTLIKTEENQLRVHFGNFDSQTGSYDSGMPASLDAIEAGCLYLWNSQIVPSFTRYYTKTEMEILLGGKADKSKTYTITQVDEELSKKQGNLTAGDGIAIVDNIISVPLSRMPLDLNEGFVNIADVNDGWYQVTVPGRFGIANTNHKRYELYTGDTVYKEGNENNFVVMAVTNSGIYVVYNSIEDWGDGYLPNTDDVTSWLDDKADKSDTYTKTQIDTALAGKQNVRTETNVADSTLTALSIAKDTDYVFKTLIGTMNFSLASTFTSGRSTLTFTTGDTPVVTIDSGVMPVKWHGEQVDLNQSNTTYEMDFRVVALPIKNESTGNVEMVNTLIIAGGAVTEGTI